MSQSTPDLEALTYIKIIPRVSPYSTSVSSTADMGAALVKWAGSVGRDAASSWLLTGVWGPVRAGGGEAVAVDARSG
jgi:hypothetical protein